MRSVEGARSRPLVGGAFRRRGLGSAGSRGSTGACPGMVYPRCGRREEIGTLGHA